MNEERASPPTLLDGPLIRGLERAIPYAVRILAALMVLVIQKYQHTRCDRLSFLFVRPHNNTVAARLSRLLVASSQSFQ